MDSAPPAAAPKLADPAADAGLPADAPPEALSRLGRVLPLVDAAARVAYRWAGAGALSAAAVGAAVAEASLTVTAAGGAVLAAVLAVPAAAVALAGWTLADLAALPGQIRAAALATATTPARGSRIARVARSVWAARGLALVAKGGWLKALGAVRFVRLASLPFALGLVGLSLLNGVVVVAGLIAVLTLIF